VPFTDEALGVARIPACRHADVASMNSSFATTAAFIATCRSKWCSASQRVAGCGPIGTWSNATIRANRKFAPGYYI
jgi:hypothetical protein